MNTNTIHRLYLKYVSQNVLGMIGMSAYILADTFFISIAQGATGIAALNLVLPVYSLIFAIGSMMGVGSATRFTIAKAREDKDANIYFSNAIFFAIIFGIVFILLGIFVPDKILGLLGGDAEIIAVGTVYTRIFMLFAPFFMFNYIFNAFVRNDGSPSIAMAATLFSSLFNIIFDYILMFPLGLGMAGAALATAFSPIVGVLICSLHFRKKHNTIHFMRAIPSIVRLFRSCQLGVSAFIGEMASGITTLVFNFLILSLAGNIGIAAYGVVANTALVATSIFNGISQGSQPLFSSFYGKKEPAAISKILKLAVLTGLGFAILAILLTQFGADMLVAIFNSENSAELASYASIGLKIYFVGYLFAGFNIIGTGYLGATENAGWSFATSILRGIVAIIVCAIVLSKLLGMIGVWLAFPTAECITAIVMIFAIIKNQRRIRY